MKKLLLNVIANIANSTSLEYKFDVGLINNKPFIFKYGPNEGIASLLMYKVLGIFYVPFIEISDEFYVFDKDEQEFILQHEFGHYKLKHYKWYFYYNVTYKEMNEMEKEADTYAMLKTSKEIALRAMNKLEDICEQENYNTTYIRERIIYLEKIKERAN